MVLISPFNTMQDLAMRWILALLKYILNTHLVTDLYRKTQLTLELTQEQSK